MALNRWVSRRALIAGGLGIAARGCELARAPAATEAAVSAHLSRLTLAEKVAQLFVFEAAGTAMTDEFAKLLAQLKPGGIILDGANITGVEGIAPFVKAIHTTNPALPPLVAVDQEGGEVSRIPNDPSPPAPTLGSESDDAVRAVSQVQAAYIRSFGFDINLAPVADVAYQPDSVMAKRSFGADPATVARKVTAMIAGSRGSGVANTAKHFPGHGRTTQDSHEAIPRIDLALADWRKSDALPFAAAIQAGTELVMVGHLRYVQWDQRPASLSPIAIDLLRRQLGFRGVVITDDLGMAALTADDPFHVLEQAVFAGNDLLLYATATAPPTDLVDYVVRFVRQGKLTLARLDTSVLRILRLKAGGK